MAAILTRTRETTPIPRVRPLPSPTTWRATNVAIALFGIVSLIKVRYHELWHEEAQAWLIARASHTPIDLLANLRAEGHPPLWYLVLWPFARLGDPVAMQVVSAVIATAAAAIILKRAPFSLAVRVLCVLSYFVLFQYDTVARSYSLELLLLVAAVDALSRAPRSRARGLIYLCLASLTSVYGAIIASALAAAFLLFPPPDRRPRAGRLPKPARTSRNEKIGLGLLVASVGYCGIQALTAPNPSVGAMTTVHQPGGGPPRALLDIFFPNVEMIWPTLFRIVHDTPVIYGLIVVASFAAISLLASRTPRAACVWTLGFIGIAAVMSISGFAAAQHRGHVAVLAFLAGWIAHSSPREQPLKTSAGRIADHRLVGVVLVIALTTSAAFGLVASIRDIAEPYTPYRAARDYLEEQGVSGADYFANWVPSTLAVLALVDRPVSYAPRWDTTRFARWDGQSRATPQATFEAASRRHNATGQPVVLLLDRPLDPVPEGVESAVFDKGFLRPTANALYVYVIR
jgi:hypothetical protein